jgi:putative FmdB family regulatory protein
MPTYDYRCTDCHRLFQARHAVNAEMPDCPDCGCGPERVILCAPAVHGHMAKGREMAARTFDGPETESGHGPGCPCCH